MGMRLRNVRTPGGRSWWTAELCWRELIPWTIGRRSEGSGSALSIGGWPEQRLYSSYRSRRLGCGSQSAALLLQCCDSVEPPLSPLSALRVCGFLFRSAPDAHFTAATHLGTPRSAAPGAGPAHPLGRPHLTDPNLGPGGDPTHRIKCGQKNRARGVCPRPSLSLGSLVAGQAIGKLGRLLKVSLPQREDFP